MRKIILIIILVFSIIILVFLISVCSSKPEEVTVDLSDLQSRRDEMHYENDIIQMIHVEYNQYFSGIYMENHVIGVCIKSDIPESVIDILEESYIPYKFVKYNYTELINIYYLVVTHEKFGEYGGAGIDFSDNSIEVYMPIGYIFPEEFSNYVEEGTIILIESDLEATF